MTKRVLSLVAFRVYGSRSYFALRKKKKENGNREMIWRKKKQLEGHSKQKKKENRKQITSITYT